MRSIANYSEAELLEELARRCTHKEQKQQVARWCHNCTHFTTWADDALKMPDNYNPCSKLHKMFFRMPEGDPHDEESGFYKVVCADRDDGA